MRYVSASVGRYRQRGAVLPLTVVALVALLATAALALDTSHAYLNKTRLQNVLDAAALDGARTLAITSDSAAAHAAAEAAFDRNADESGNGELRQALSRGGVQVVVETSTTLEPFVAGSEPPQYLRVRAAGLSLASWFAQVIGIDEKTFAGSAVAGPLPVFPCDLTPLLICGDPSATEGTHFGYEQGEVVVLKGSAGGGSFEIGPGNFQLLRLPGGQGANDVRNALAGEHAQCESPGGQVETEPGNTIGPVAQGINTRFGIYQGPVSPADHPPDKVTTQADYPSLAFRHEDYLAAYAAEAYTEPGGADKRRELKVVIGDCADTVQGQGEVPVLGVGCFFLLDPVAQQGYEAEIYGEFIEHCTSRGNVATDPNWGLGQPREIVLHKDPDSSDS